MLLVPSATPRLLVECWSVIAFRDADGDLHGINAWPATGADLRIYEEGTNNGKDN